MLFILIKVEIVLIELKKKCGFICVCNDLILVFFNNLFCVFVLLSLIWLLKIFVNFFVSWCFIKVKLLGFVKYIFNVLMIELCILSGIMIVVLSG